MTGVQTCALPIYYETLRLNIHPEQGCSITTSQSGIGERHALSISACGDNRQLSLLADGSIRCGLEKYVSDSPNFVGSGALNVVGDAMFNRIVFPRMGAQSRALGSDRLPLIVFYPAASKVAHDRAVGCHEAGLWHGVAKGETHEWFCGSERVMTLSAATGLTVSRVNLTDGSTMTFEDVRNPGERLKDDSPTSGLAAQGDFYTDNLKAVSGEFSDSIRVQRDVVASRVLVDGQVGVGQRVSMKESKMILRRLRPRKFLQDGEERFGLLSPGTTNHDVIALLTHVVSAMRNKFKGGALKRRVIFRHQ